MRIIRFLDDDNIVRTGLEAESGPAEGGRAEAELLEGNVYEKPEPSGAGATRAPRDQRSLILHTHTSMPPHLTNPDLTAHKVHNIFTTALSFLNHPPSRLVTT